MLLADTRTPQGTRDAFGSDAYPGAVLFAREQWLRDNHDRALRVTTAVLNAMQWIRETAPNEVAQRIPPQYRIADRSIEGESVQHLIPALSPDGVMPAELPDHVNKVLSTFDPGVRSAAVDVRQTFTNEFVPGR